MNLSTRYVVKGIGKEQKIDSVILIHHDGNGKIEKVEDKWNGELPDSTFSNVSFQNELVQMGFFWPTFFEP